LPLPFFGTKAISSFGLALASASKCVRRDCHFSLIVLFLCLPLTVRVAARRNHLRFSAFGQADLFNPLLISVQSGKLVSFVNPSPCAQLASAPPVCRPASARRYFLADFFGVFTPTFFPLSILLARPVDSWRLFSSFGFLNSLPFSSRVRTLLSFLAIPGLVAFLGCCDLSTHFHFLGMAQVRHTGAWTIRSEAFFLPR